MTPQIASRADQGNRDATPRKSHSDFAEHLRIRFTWTARGALTPAARRRMAATEAAVQEVVRELLTPGTSGSAA